jgi:tRNA A37 threonylcarbamoyladenosine dehydratase
MAKQKLKALIVGAGGVTSYMLPALKNSFDLEVTLIDGDILEKRNLDRQLFRNNHGYEQSTCTCKDIHIPQERMQCSSTIL